MLGSHFQYILLAYTIYLERVITNQNGHCAVGLKCWPLSSKRKGHLDEKLKNVITFTLLLDIVFLYTVFTWLNAAAFITLVQKITAVTIQKQLLLDALTQCLYP